MNDQQHLTTYQNLLKDCSQRLIEWVYQTLCSCDINSPISQGGRGHWGKNYTIPQSVIITISHLFGTFTEFWLVGSLEKVSKRFNTDFNLQGGNLCNLFGM